MACIPMVLPDYKALPIRSSSQQSGNSTGRNCAAGVDQTELRFLRASIESMLHSPAPATIR